MPKSEKTPEEQARSRRNYAIALACLAFVALVFAITILRMKEGLHVQHF